MTPRLLDSVIWSYQSKLAAQARSGGADASKRTLDSDNAAPRHGIVAPGAAAAGMVEEFQIGGRYANQRLGAYVVREVLAGW
jgi:hypothetical protein